jgi:hypothetical protein
MASEARAFLDLVFAGKPEDLLFRLWIPSWNQSCLVPYVDVAAECAESLAGQEVYVGLGLTGGDYSAAEGCAPVELTALAGVSIDIDLRSDAHPQATRPQTAEQAISILPPELPPTCVVHTGDGVQACWLFQKLHTLENNEARMQAASLTQRLNTLIRDNGRMRGWTIDRVADVARLLRVPGTTNCTDPANPKPVTIGSRTDRRYSPSELIEYLDDMEVPDQDAAETKREWAERFKDKPLTINLAVRISDDLLNEWLATDHVFKNTWFRQRSDLSDQSQWQYDLALGFFGLSAGLAEQQIIDLIIHHRAMHKQKARTRLDYYYRTLAKTSDYGGAGTTRGTAAGPARESERCTPRSEAPGPATGAPSRSNPERAKIALCDELSEALGLEILRIVKLSGQDPAYRIELAEGKVHFGNVGKFISQSAVRSAIAARTGKLIPDFKPKSWLQVAQSMLEACIVEDGGAELEPEGAARMYLGQYLEENAFIPSIAGQIGANKRKPMVYRGRITVCASDLQTFVNTTTRQNLSVRAVAAMLSVIEAKSVRVRGKGFKEQGRWELPVSEFDPADYPVPEFDSPRSLQQHG